MIDDETVFREITVSETSTIKGNTNQDSGEGHLWVGGERDALLLATIRERVRARLKAGTITNQTIEHVSTKRFAVLQSSQTNTQVDDEAVEHLRTMCQLWDVRLAPRDITSHRRFVGPLIVAIKRLMVPVLQFIFRDFIRQQRAFNAAAIKAIGHLTTGRS